MTTLCLRANLYEIGDEDAARITAALEKNASGIRCVLVHPSEQELATLHFYQ